MSKIHAFQRLSSRQLLWVWSAYWRLWPVLIRIKFKQFFRNPSWIKKRITFVQNCSRNKLADSTTATQMHESVRLAGRLHFIASDCLPKSLVLADMLRVRKMNANVVIGVSKVAGKFSSHAWVELDSKMVVEAESVQQQFTSISINN